MNKMSARALAVKTASELASEWERSGWRLGLPPSVSEAVFQIDQQVYRSFACSGCRRRRQDVRPYCKGTQYRLLLACQNLQCGRGEAA